MIRIKGFALPIKPLINNNKRVIISNIQPIITNDAIIEALKAKGVKILSNISELRASTSKPGRSHKMSLRRQFYISEEHEAILPETLQFTYGDTTFWSYLSTDSASCFICKQSRHISKTCLRPFGKNSQKYTEKSVKITLK